MEWSRSSFSCLDGLGICENTQALESSEGKKAEIHWSKKEASSANGNFMCVTLSGLRASLVPSNGQQSVANFTRFLRNKTCWKMGAGVICSHHCWSAAHISSSVRKCAAARESCPYKLTVRGAGSGNSQYEVSYAWIANLWLLKESQPISTYLLIYVISGSLRLPSLTVNVERRRKVHFVILMQSKKLDYRETLTDMLEIHTCSSSGRQFRFLIASHQKNIRELCYYVPSFL